MRCIGDLSSGKRRLGSACVRAATAPAYDEISSPSPCDELLPLNAARAKSGQQSYRAILSRLMLPERDLIVELRPCSRREGQLTVPGATESRTLAGERARSSVQCSCECLDCVSSPCVCCNITKHREDRTQHVRAAADRLAGGVKHNTAAIKPPSQGSPCKNLRDLLRLRYQRQASDLTCSPTEPQNDNPARMSIEI